MAKDQNFAVLEVTGYSDPKPTGYGSLGLGSSIRALGGHGVLAERAARGKEKEREEEEDWRRKGK